MKIMNKISAKAADLRNQPVPVIAFLGDSVTQGCFEIYKKNDGTIETVFDGNSAYHCYLSQVLRMLFPNVPVVIVNAGISGDNVLGGLERLERDVLRHNPDLTVVCFGLNDAMNEQETPQSYAQGLMEIFNRLQERGSEVIFMTANHMNDHISCHLDQDPDFQGIAKAAMELQNSGKLREYFNKGKEAARACEVRVCDVYAMWDKLAANGVDTTHLLSNHINHPTREMNWLFAIALLWTMMEY